MDLFNDFMGNTVDLDDVGIYSDEWKCMHVHDFFSKCMRDAGRSLFYMGFLHPSDGEGSQKQRVDVLCRELSGIWHNARVLPVIEELDQYNLELFKWLYKFEDEVENQC